MLRFVYLYFRYIQTGQSGVGRNVQSVTIGGTLLTVGFLIFLFGVMADINSTQRTLLEEILYRQRKQEVDGGAAASGSGEEDESVGRAQEQGHPPEQT
ncbi:MAG: hypothetical protein D6790_10860 [Caldilineae bacterium]|nr:MAG: hypothetical protein D6790_10860 [Caldilineae bacterium]